MTGRGFLISGSLVLSVVGVVASFSSTTLLLVVAVLIVGLSFVAERLCYNGDREQQRQNQEWAQTVADHLYAELSKLPDPPGSQIKPIIERHVKSAILER